MRMVMFKKPNGEHISINPDFIMLIEGVDPNDKKESIITTKEPLSNIFISNNYSSFTMTVRGTVEILLEQINNNI